MGRNVSLNLCSVTAAALIFFMAGVNVVSWGVPVGSAHARQTLQVWEGPSEAERLRRQRAVASAMESIAPLTVERAGSAESAYGDHTVAPRGIEEESCGEIPYQTESPFLPSSCEHRRG